MKKLTDVLKYNKEIQKKNQGAVINLNNPVKPKQTINVFPSVNNPTPSPIEQIRTAAPKTTTLFEPVRTNVSDIREEVNPVNGFNTFMQTPKGQEILQRFKDNYSYITEISSVVNNASVMGKNRKALNNEINEHERQVANFGYKFQQNKGVRSTEDAMTYDFHRTNLKIKRKDKEKMLNSVSEQIAEKYTPEQINHYISIYERNNPDDAEMINALKIAETLTYLKAEQREYNEAFEKAQSGDAETLAIIEKGKQNYKAPTNLMGVPMSGSLPEDVQNWYDEQYPEEANFKNYIFGKYDTEKAEKMWKKHLQDKSNQSLIDASKDNAVLKNVAMPIYNIGTQLLSPIYGAEMLVQNTKNMYSGKNEPVSMYSPGSAVMSAKDASAEAFTVGDSEGTAFLKNVLLSVGGNAANVALFGAATPYMMALQSGSSTAYETMKKGGTTQQAVLNGVIGGTIEYFTEKLPFEKLTETFAGAKGLKNMSKADVTKFIASRIGLQAVAEYGEETVNSYASTIADMIVMGEKSDYMQYVNELVKDGQSTEKAYEMANKKFFLTDPQMAGLSGLISGGLMSTGAVTLGTMKAASEGKGQVVTYTASDKLDKDALETLNNIAKASGVNITVEDLAPVEVTDENGNKKYMINKGETDADGTIRINSSEMGSVEDALVAYHEVTHTLENTEAYDAYRDIALNIMYGGRGTDTYNQAMSAKSSQYGDKAQGTDLLEKELVAEFTRTQLSNEGVVERIVAENRNVATKIYNALKKAYTNIKNKLQGKETNLTDMEKAINLFEKALGENRKMSFTEALVKGNTDTRPYIDEEGMVQFDEGEQGEKRYAIETLPDGKKYVQADRQVMFSSNPDSWGEDLEKYVNDEIRKGKDVKVTSEDGNVLTITAKTAWKLGDRNEVTMPDGNKRLMTDDEYATKLTAGSHIDEIAQLLKGNDKYVPDTKDHDFAKDGFTYKNAFFRDFDGTYYRLGVSIGKSGEIKSIYNIGILDKRSFPSTGSSTPKGGAQNVGKASKNNIPHQKAIVNNNDMQKSQNNAQGSNGKQHLLGAVIEEGATTEENSVLEYNSTAKSRTRLERYENEAVRKVADAMSVRLGTAREFLKPIIQEMSNEYMKTGKLSQDTIDRLFEEAYKNGRKVNDEAYKEYADLRNYLRNTKIYFDSESAADIPDFFKDIRRYMGRLSVSSTNGTSVDSIYQELNEMHPSLFPEDILSSSDRMLRIMEVSDSLRKEEVTLDAYYNTEEAKGDLKHKFEKAVYAFKDNLYEVKHFNDSLESDVVEKHNPFEITGGYVEKELKLEQSKSGLVTVYSKDWALGPDSAPVKVIEGLAKLSNSRLVIEDLDPVEVIGEDGEKKLVDNMGFVQDGVIHINSANVKTRLGAMVTLHEVTHNIENSDLYDAYKKLAFDILYGGENTESYKEAYNTIAERYGDKVSSKEDIDKELVANFTMTKLDEKVINRIVMQNRNVAVRMFNALKNAYNKVENFITGTEQDLSDIERALDIFDRALAERRETIDNSDLTPFVDEEGKVRFGDGEGGIKYYLGDFKHQVDAVLDKEAPEKLKSGLSVYVGKTTKLLRKAGLDDLPMLMNQGHLRDINHEKTPDNIHYHGLDIETIKQLPLQLKEPVMIYDSISPHKKENTVCVVTSLTDKDGYPVIVTIRANSDEGGNRYIDVSLEERKADKTNFVTSMYGKDNFWSHIEEVVDNDAMIYMNKNKTQRLASDNELYLLTRLDKLGYDNIIHQSRNIVNNNDMQKSQNNSQESNGKQHLLGAVIEEGATTEENSTPEYNSTAKSRTRLERYENEAVRKVADAMSVRLGTAREFLKPIIQEMSTEYMKTGKLSQDTIDRLFEEAYKNGKIVNDEAYKEYADLRNYLRNTKIYFDSESATDIPDFFKDIRRYMGRLSVSSTNGTSVDSIYQELNEMHPSLFPEDILSSSDRMLRIMEVSDSLRKEEVTLDAYYNTEETKGDLKRKFEKAVYAFKDNLYEVKHFNDSLESDVVEKTTKKPLKEGEIEAPESFEELCGKGLVKVINISKPEDMRTYRQRRIDIRKNAEKAEIFSKPYENRDTGMKIFIVPNSYTHTFSNKGEENIRVAEHLPELIENAVLTHKEQFNRKSAETEYVYTFFGAVYDGQAKAVKLKVKEFNTGNFETIPQNIKKYLKNAKQMDKYSTLYDAKVLAVEVIDIIKEPDASGKADTSKRSVAQPTSSSISTDASGKVPYNNGKVTQSTSSSNISVSQLMKLVKGDAEKYIPKSGVQEAYSKLSIYQKEADKVMNRLLLTKDENAILEDMLKGKRSADAKMIPDGMNKGNIMQAYEAKSPVKAMQNIIENHKKSVRKNKNDTAMKMIELSDFWKDKKNGLMYMINSQERNVEDIVKNDKQADKIIETYFKPVHDHEGDRKKFKHEYFKRVCEMEIDLRVRSGNKNTESEAIQFIGEVEGDIADLETKAKNRKLTDDENDKLINLKGSLVEFKENNPNLDYNKINSCIKEFHKIYDELFEEMNIVRVRNGYAPVEYRKNYFPHFMETGTDEITGKIAKALGINVDVTELPTDLAGRTENFKPGIAWVQHVKRRNTNVTKYDAVEGFQKYIEGVSDVIFHTDDIQNLRALERALRYKYSEKGVKDEIDALRDRTDVTDDERETLLEEAGKRKITHLGHYVNNLTEYTNLLANKKHSWDRPFENALGRGIYNVLNWGNSRVASNLIVGNLSTPLTNLIPLVQATPLVGEINMMVGFNQTVKNFLYDDGMTERSTFLTNRFGQEKLISKSKVADKLVWLMETVDELSSGTVWRARYHQNIKKGMSDADAIKDADKYAANLIADRSKGSLPTLFGVKNPIVKAFTAFQVETNNQLHHLFKDIPKEAGEKLALVLFKYFLGAYLFNDVYEKVVGRRPALDPLSWTNEFVGDLTGYQMPNSIDIIASLVKREKVDFSTTKFKNSQAIANLGKNIAEDIPFIGGMLGGGRIPISSALPDVGELNKLNDDISNKKKAEIIHKNTISGGLINILMPYAGSQLTKTMKGIKAFAEGGSYSLNNDGKEQLQYPMERDLLTGAQSAIFGKNATKGARNWVEEGFGSLTAEQTDLYQRIVEDKNTSRTDVYNAISNARKAESVKDGDKSRTETQVRHEIVSKAKGLSWKQKYMIEYSFMSDENKEKIKAMTNNGVSQDTAYRVLYEYADSKEVSKEAKYKKYYEMSDGGTSVVAEKWGYEPELSVIKREALAHDSKLTAEEKQTINTALFGESETEYDFSNVDNYYYSTLSKNQKKGYDQYIKLYGKNSMNARTFYYAIKVMNSTKDGNGSKKVAKVTRLRKAGFTLAQANRIYNILN